MTRTKMAGAFFLGCVVGILFGTWIWWTGALRAEIFGPQVEPEAGPPARPAAIEVVRHRRRAPKELPGDVLPLQR